MAPRQGQKPRGEPEKQLYNNILDATWHYGGVFGNYGSNKQQSGS